MSDRARCGPALSWPSSWPSSWRASTQTRSALWARGAATQYCSTSTQKHRRLQRGLQCAWSNMGTMRLSSPPRGAKSPAFRLWASPWTFMGYSGRPGIWLVRIRKINSPYHTRISKYIPSSSVDILISLAGKVAISTKTCREKGGNMRMHAHNHTHITFQVLRT